VATEGVGRASARPLAVAYYRVSTAKQGRSGLGLAAQRQAVAAFAEREDYTIIAEHTEVETGKGADALERRPVLAAALAQARKTRAVVLVSKLCRLGRDVAFISKLMAERVPFVVSELGPDVPSFMLHVVAAMAQEERRLISQRTREALAVRKAQGAKLGNRTNLAEAQALGAAVRAAKADRFALNLEPIIEQTRASGISTLKGIADALNARGVPTGRGGRFHAATVKLIMKRLGSWREPR